MQGKVGASAFCCKRSIDTLHLNLTALDGVFPAQEDKEAFMNCREFSGIVTDLAGSNLMDASMRASGFRHAKGCSRCASRLDSERALVEGLRALAAADAESAPERSEFSERALRAEFRRRHAAVASGSQSITGRSAAARRILLYAAAAVALLGGGLLAAIFSDFRRDVERDAESMASTQAQVKALAVEASRDRAAIDLKAEVVQVAGRRMKQTPPNRIAAVTGDESFITVSIGEFSQLIDEEEVATDYLPLIVGTEVPPVENGQVIRVQMPRSALASFGLPFDLERANESVKADVLVGDDGLARAVRFVR